MQRSVSAPAPSPYLHADHLGSTVLTTSGTGAQTSANRYYAYGAIRSASGALPTDYAFTGGRKDGYTTLYRMGARWYDSYLNRWIQPDPIVPDPTNPQSLNRYSYVYNRPTVAVDPDGHFAWFVTGAIGAAGGAIFSVGQQVVSGMYSGLSVTEAFSQVDGRKVATAAVVGGVAGLTMGASTVLLGSGLLATGVSGATAGILGGGTERLANAGWGEYDRWRAGQSIELQRAWDDAVQHGLLDPKSIAVGAGSGVVSAYVGAGLGKLLQKAGVNTLETINWSGATTSKPTPSLQLLPNGTAYLKYGRETLYLPEDKLTLLANAVTAGNIALIQELLSQAAGEGAKPALQQTLP